MWTRATCRIFEKSFWYSLNNFETYEADVNLSIQKLYHNLIEATPKLLKNKNKKKKREESNLRIRCKNPLKKTPKSSIGHSESAIVETIIHWRSFGCTSTCLTAVVLFRQRQCTSLSRSFGQTSCFMVLSWNPNCLGVLLFIIHACIYISK